MTLSVTDRRPTWPCSPKTPCLTARLNPVVEALDSDDYSQAVVRSTLLVIDPAPPITIRAAAAITQILQRRNGSWYIARRTVAAHGEAGP